MSDSKEKQPQPPYMIRLGDTLLVDVRTIDRLEFCEETTVWSERVVINRENVTAATWDEYELFRAAVEAWHEWSRAEEKWEFPT